MSDNTQRPTTQRTEVRDSPGTRQPGTSTGTSLTTVKPPRR